MSSINREDQLENGIGAFFALKNCVDKMAVLIKKMKNLKNK